MSSPIITPLSPTLLNEQLKRQLEMNKSQAVAPRSFYSTIVTDIQRPTNTRLDDARFFEKTPEDLASDEVNEQHNSEEKNKKRRKTGISALVSNSPAETKYRSVGMYAMGIANAGIFLQNIAALTRSGILDKNPQSFNLLGSMVNLSSIFMPMHLRLPAFVAGTSLYMGGAALAQSHENQAQVAQPVRSEENFSNIADKAKWNSYKYFPHPAYTKEVNGKKVGFMHMAHPGTFAAMARAKFFNVYKPMFRSMQPTFDSLEKKLPFVTEQTKYIVPSMLANIAGSTAQLGWMTGKLLTDWNFAHDALTFFERREFLKGTTYKIPNAPEYALALGAVIPLALMSGALAVDGMNKLKEMHEKKDVSEHAVNLAPEKTAPTSSKKEDPFAKKHSSNVELVANASSVIPQLANLMFLPIIMAEGIGKPVKFIVKGLSKHHQITPTLNAGLIATSVGSLVSAVAATVSDLAIVPRYVAYISDIMFMAFSGATSAGLMRNVFEAQFENPQIAHLVPSMKPFKYMDAVVEAKHKGWTNLWDSRRVPKLPELEKLKAEISG